MWQIFHITTIVTSYMPCLAKESSGTYIRLFTGGLCHEFFHCQLDSYSVLLFRSVSPLCSVENIHLSYFGLKPCQAASEMISKMEVRHRNIIENLSIFKIKRGHTVHYSKTI